MIPLSDADPLDLDAVLERNRDALARIGHLPASEATRAAIESLWDVEGLVAELSERRQAEVAATSYDLLPTIPSEEPGGRYPSSLDAKDRRGG